MEVKMNKKIISIVVITILIVVSFYFLVGEIQNLSAKIDDLNDKVQVIVDEYSDLIIENEELQVEFDDELSAMNEELEETEQKLNEVIEVSKKLSYPDEASIYILKDMGIEDYSILTDSLSELGEDIIGFQGILGGTMYFTNVKILNDRWAFGRFEDGHYGGYGIYKFEINGDDIVWNTIVEYSDN